MAKSALIPISFCYSVISGQIRDPELEITNCDLKIASYYTAVLYKWRLRNESNPN